MELLRALAVLAEPPTPETARIARALELSDTPSASAYTDLFVFQLYPYASFYLGREGMLGGEARDRIAGAWRAVGATPPAEPDHLAVLLAAQARATDLESAERDPARREARRRLRTTLAWEHLLSWIGPYLVKVTEIGAPPYREWASLLRSVLADEATTLGPPPTLPLALRAIGENGPPDTSELLPFVLAPIRSGIVITRADLARCARDLQLGTRHGERRYILQALLDQDVHRTVMWLADEARRWITLHEAEQHWLGDIAFWWASRAAHTVDTLAALAPSHRH